MLTLDNKDLPCDGIALLPPQGMLSSMISDEDLMRQYQAGDASAFSQLYEKYKGDVYRFLSRQLEPAIAEELYQDIWMKLIQAKDRYQQTASFRTYLYTITHNRLRDHWRKHANTQQLAHDNTHDEQSAEQLTLDAINHDINNPETINNDRRAVEALLEGIRLLPQEQQQAFLLKNESGLTLDEIAHVMQASKESTKSRLRYAIKKLRKHLRGIWP